MDSKDIKSSHPKTTHREVSTNNDSTFKQFYPTGTKSADESKHERPGEAIMKSDDPRTAELRAWAEDRQMQVPGSNGSFALGEMSMGTGAVSGGPMLLPRNEYIVEPPFHTMDHGPVEVVKHGEGGEGMKKRHSILDLFKKKKEKKGEAKE